MKALTRLLLVLFVGGTACAVEPIAPPAVPVPVVRPGQIAAKPLFRDPVFDGAADPTLIWNRAEKKWFMFYTNRRANVPGLTAVTWVHGTPIGIAESADGATWSYRGTVDFPQDIPNTAGTPTFWAPAVVYDQGVYHMFVVVVPGIFTDWNHPRNIVHVTSPDLKKWKYEGTLPLVTDKVIDPCVLRLPDGTWRMWYNNERAGKSTFYADSPDLYRWTDRGSAHLPRDRGEAPVAFFWQGHYWLLIDLLGNNGLGAYKSDDALTWTRQPASLLATPGTGKDDQNGGHHPEVILSGERAFLFYFVHPGVAADSGAPDHKRSSIQVVELAYRDGWLTCDRDQPTHIQLLPPDESRKTPESR
ncbi:MAG TPA: glycosyl hydrolase [Opitutaceae bacterium]|nr:glycosyl hydrolase [Opitutaceae bacterium]